MPSHPSSPRRAGIIDLGSNTVRLVVFEHQPGRWFRLVDSIRERARLAEGLTEDGMLHEAAVDRALAAIELYADYAEAAELDSLEVIATSAVRDSKNGGDLLERIAGLGLEVRLLSGEEEAGLGVNAVANGLLVDDAWVVDQGGGSAQGSLMADRRWQWGTAYPLGALRLAERHFGLGARSDKAKPAQIERAESEIAEHMRPFAERMQSDRRPLVAIGGTIRCVARIIQKRENYPFEVLHGYRVAATAIDDLLRDLIKLDYDRRCRLPGMSSERADLVLPAALLFRWLLRQGERDELIVSGHGLREGAFYRRFLSHPHLLEDRRAFSVGNLFAQFGQPRLHAERVMRLALEMFDGLRELHGYGAEERELLARAAILHDVGMTIDYYRHDHHGAFLLGSSALNGFSHREQILLILLVRYHRKGTPSTGPFAMVLRRDDRERLGVLTVCLRLAEHLERSRSGRVVRVAVETSKRSVRLRLFGPVRPSVEIWEAAKDARLFSRVFHRRLDLEYGGSDGIAPSARIPLPGS